MGQTDIYGKRVLMAATLTPAGSAPFLYGFLTNVDAGELGPLGLTTPATGTFVTIGANLPKPTRMIKKENGYSISSFASTANVKTALGAKWKIQKAGSRYRHRAGNSATTGTSSVSVYVEVAIPGGASPGGMAVKYAWRMPRQQAAKMDGDDFTQLGIVVPATDNDARDMIFGINNLVPARASKTTGADGEAASFTLTTFYDTTRPLSDWKPVSSIQIRSAKPEF